MKYILFLIIIGGIVMATGLNREALSSNTLETATFAGGCFWCMETPFVNISGVKNVISGYTGGTTENPTYDDVCSGSTGHLEAVQITFNPKIVSYKKLLDIFWRNINPTDPGGQFADRGKQYTTAIFYHSEKQKTEAEQSHHNLEMSGKFEDAIVTTIRPARTFYKAEKYHQQYFKKKPFQYKQYWEGSGRGPFIRRMWEKSESFNRQRDTTIKFIKTGDYFRPSDDTLKEILSPIQYDVAVCSATEPPFKNKYWDNHKEGIYIDIITGEPLFSSNDKFNSGTGWPSFTCPIDEKKLMRKKDLSLGMRRIEVRSKNGNTHLGHLFNDGPAPSGLRYCINSAALRFIPKEELEREGYGKYLHLFE